MTSFDRCRVCDTWPCSCRDDDDDSDAGWGESVFANDVQVRPAHPRSGSVDAAASQGAGPSLLVLGLVILFAFVLIRIVTLAVAQW